MWELGNVICEYTDEIEGVYLVCMKYMCDVKSNGYYLKSLTSDWESPIVTTLEALQELYEADGEDIHDIVISNNEFKDIISNWIDDNIVVAGFKY